MPTRTAQTTWTGGLQDGAGTVELVSSGIASYEVSFPKRAADDADGTTSPEELIAAAHSSCFAMQFSALLGAAGGSSQSLRIRADVTLGPDPAGGFRISGINLTVRGSADGITPEQFAKTAQDAKTGCPVSKALTGTEITLDVAGAAARSPARPPPASRRGGAARSGSPRVGPPGAGTRRPDHPSCGDPLPLGGETWQFSKHPY